MSLVSINSVGKEFGAQTVLENITLRVGRGEKIGIVGKNGGGKTTLLKIILGIETPDAGSVSLARGVRIGYLSQVALLDETRTVRAEAETALSSLADAEAELRESEIRLAESPDDADALESYGAAADRFHFLGGDGARDHLSAALAAMGFSERDLDKPVSVLSGGEKTRLAMAKLLTASPDVLALDEPTNHLDIRAVEWLEGYLQGYPGAVIVVSHDRRFLDRVIGTTWELECHEITVYTGGFAKYREIRAANRARELDEYNKQQGEIARTEEYIRRNKAGQNSRNAMGRAKQLARVERIERPAEEKATMAARVDTSGRTAREVVVCERATKRYGDKAILDNVTLTIERGQRVGVVGANGVGKSTFIEMIVGDEEPDSGFVRRGHGVTIAYHRQEADDFDPEESVLETFFERAAMTAGEARSHLGKFLFTGEDVFKPVGALSGGERSKLALAIMVLSPANLLILDEPTNHLDVYSCDALTDALALYKGTLILVSHDRALLDAATDTTLSLSGGGKAELFEGGYGAWRAETERLAKLAAASVATAPKPKAVTSAAPAAPSANAREQSKERQRAAKRIATAEADVTRWEDKLAAIEAALSVPTAPDEVIRLSREYAEARDKAAAMEEWEAATVAAEGNI